MDLTTYTGKPAVLLAVGGLGNAILTALTAGRNSRYVNSVKWIPHHNINTAALLSFITLPLSSDYHNGLAIDDIFSYDNLYRLVQNSAHYDANQFKYINTDFIKTIQQDANVCALHIRLGDFKSYGKDYYVPDAEYIARALTHLPEYIDTLKIFTNGSHREVDALLSQAGCYDKYNVVWHSGDESIASNVLIEMMKCGSIIRTGSTLSLCAVIFKKFDTIVYSINQSSQYFSEKVKIDLPGAHAIIVL